MLFIGSNVSHAFDIELSPPTNPSENIWQKYCDSNCTGKLICDCRFYVFLKSPTTSKSKYPTKATMNGFFWKEYYIFKLIEGYWSYEKKELIGVRRHPASPTPLHSHTHTPPTARCKGFMFRIRAVSQMKLKIIKITKLDKICPW